MNCPQCGCAEVRPSKKRSWRDVLHRTMGRRPWRCCRCYRRFYAAAMAGSPDETPAPPPKGAHRHPKQRSINRARRRRKHLIEAAVFGLLLIIFFLFLRYLTREPPTEESGQIRAYRVDAPG